MDSGCLLGGTLPHNHRLSTGVGLLNAWIRELAFSLCAEVVSEAKGMTRACILRPHSLIQ